MVTPLRWGRRVAASLARLRRRHLALGVTACLVGAAAAWAPLSPTVSSCAAGKGLGHVALVVEHGDGRLVVTCVAFSGPTISGAEVLRRSGIEYATTGYAGLGQAVCQLDGEPATYPASCWTDSGRYWAMFGARAGGAWTPSSLGISSQTFRDGDAEGFRYAAQTGTLAPPAAVGRCPPTSRPTVRPAASPARSPATAPTTAPPHAPRDAPAGMSPTAARTPGPTAWPSPSGFASLAMPVTPMLRGSGNALAGTAPSGEASARPADARASSTTPSWLSWVVVVLAGLVLATLGLAARRRRGVP
jgi:hypothetical protein